jgi:soluble lytic murein transglycosylase-like protein
VIGFAADRIARIESIPEPPPAPPAQEPAAVPEPIPSASDSSACDVPEEPAPTPSASSDAEEQNLESIIRAAATRYKLEVDLLAAVIAVESGYRSDAISPKGAQGLMQLMPATAKDLAVVDPFDPRENVFAGARYLRELLDKNGDQYWRALAAYNAGSGRVARYDGLPPYKETIAYIRKVIDLYARPKPIPPVPTAR